jgi:RNA polymerase sigma-70 factor, ECF subfamily
LADYLNLTDQELTTLLIRGDSLAYSVVFERYSRLLVSHAYKMLQDKEHAADTVQDLMLSLWDKRTQLNSNLSLSAYLYTGLRNRIFNAMAHRKVIEKYADSIISYMEGTHVYSDDVFKEKELAALLQKEISALPEKMREVFVLYKMEELSYNEIAQRLGITDRTAKQQVYNAVKILKTKITAYLSLFPFI